MEEMKKEVESLKRKTLRQMEADAPRAHLSVNKIKKGYAECNVRLTAAGHEK